MKPFLTFFSLSTLLLAVSLFASAEPERSASAEPLPTLEEARGRARLLQRTIHAVLQVVHRDFFRPHEKLPIPSQTLEDVFDDLETNKNVTLRWIAVSTKAMDEDHKPEDEFEKKAAIALSSGKDEFEATERNIYRLAGPIRLHGSCIKCHVPLQQGDTVHNAGLVISMPFRKE